MALLDEFDSLDNYIIDLFAAETDPVAKAAYVSARVELRKAAAQAEAAAAVREIANIMGAWPVRVPG